MHTPDNWSPRVHKSEREIELAAAVIDFQNRVTDEVAGRLIERGGGELVETLDRILLDDQQNVIMPIATDDPHYSPETPYHYFSEEELAELVERSGAALERGEHGTGE
jgi:hypothetical protein